MVPREAPELLKRRSGLCGRALSPWKRQSGLRGAVNTKAQAHFEPAARKLHGAAEARCKPSEKPGGVWGAVNTEVPEVAF